MEIEEKSNWYSDFTLDRYNKGELSKDRFNDIMLGILTFNEMREEYKTEQKKTV